MAVSILKTKLYIPPARPDLVARPHLVARLDQGLRAGCKLILVSAPAGFGKTALLGVWAAGCGCDVCWLTLDGGDNDPARFLAYLVAALQTIDPAIGQGLQHALYVPHQPAMEPILTGLINELAERQAQCVIVLDDYHEISEPVVHSALSFIVDHLPPHVHLAIATRIDPPLALARLRARREVTELRLGDLRFTLDEAAAFLTRVTGAPLGVEAVRILASRTEGWAAGLQMAALSMQGQRDHDAFVRDFSGSDRYVLDYLVEEVLSRQPDCVQAFLLQTSILERLCAPLCDAVLCDRQAKAPAPQDADAPAVSGGVPCPPASSQDMLAYLERANLFLVPLDSHREWYRYHRLFADLLQVRLARAYGSQVADLHRRASQWCEAHGLLEDAIEHALGGGDRARAADLLERAAEGILSQGELSTFLRWARALPDALLRSRPGLSVLYAWMLLVSGGSLDEVESRLRDAARGGDAVAGRVTGLRALLAVVQGDMPHAAELFHQALVQLPQGELLMRSFMSLLAASRLAAYQGEAGIERLSEVMSAGQEAGNVMVTVSAKSLLAEEMTRQARLGEAEALYREALALATDERGRRLPIAGDALKGLGDLARQRNELEAAERYLEESIALTERWSTVGPIEAYMALAQVRWAQGDLDGAQDLLQQAWDLAVRYDATEIDDLAVAMLRAQLSIARGDLAAARRWAQEQGLLDGRTGDTVLLQLSVEQEMSSETLADRLRKYELVVMARFFLAQGQPERALELLNQVLPVAERRRRGGLRIEVCVLQALAHRARGDTDRALRALEHALVLAEPEGFASVFLIEGEPLARLLYEAAARGIAPGYAGKLLAAFRFPAPAPTRDEMIEPLSEREVEVLRLIAEGLSNAEVARQLVLSTSTIKGHTSTIYQKLGVHSRTQAVAKARALRILPPG
ncbi:MAG: tetratricopeptide repeat protein [Anaerolineae bacterium]|nr:tetratricopeptide repeat protein [Anaerolineae bacterium]